MMRNHALAFAVVVVALLLPATRLKAQEQDLSRFLIEGRFGAIGIPAGKFLDISPKNHFPLGEFVVACNQGPGICQNIWNFIGNDGEEGRWVPSQRWSFLSVGTDYTGFEGSTNQTVFTLGFHF